MSKQFFNKMQNSSTQSTSNNQTNMFIQSCQDNKKNNIVILKEYKGHKISRGAKAGEWRNGYNLIELNGDKCYQMDVENGESFFFSLESLSEIRSLRSGRLHESGGMTDLRSQATTSS